MLKKKKKFTLKRPQRETTEHQRERDGGETDHQGSDRLQHFHLQQKPRQWNKIFKKN